MVLNNKEVSNRIRNIRLNLGLTMEEFGNQLNTSKGAVNNWEKEKSLPNKERLKKIAELGNMSVNELLYGSFAIFTLNLVNEVKKEIMNERKIKLKLTNGGKRISNDVISICEEKGLSYENISEIKNIIRQVILDEISEGNYTVDSRFATSKKHIEDYFRKYLASDKEHVINDNALKDSVNCFFEIDIPIEDMDFMTVYMRNIYYYEDSNGYPINSKETYISFLKDRIEYSKKKINDKDVSSMEKSAFEIILKIDTKTLKEIQ
ncbi:helix-turn-helix domain-containing protein [Carnobacterium jeotgali]